MGTATAGTAVRSAGLFQTLVEAARRSQLIALCLFVSIVHAAATDAALISSVQTGTTTIAVNGTVTVTISSVDTTKSFLVFQTRHDLNRPVASDIRGRIASSTTLEFARVTDEATPVTVTIRWYVLSFSSGVNVQRGEFTQSAATTDITITAVAAVNQAFVTWSKTPASTDQTTNYDDPVVGELTSTTNLQFRINTANASHMVWWQVVEFTNAADINVQKGSITTMTGTTTSVTATLTTPVDVDKTFVLVGFTGSGTGPDMGARMLRAELTNSTTITIDRSISGSPDDITEIGWQAVELKDGSRVFRGSQNFASGVAQSVVSFGGTVNTNRAVAFASVQQTGGQNEGRTPYAADDIAGVAAVTMALSATQITMDRDNTADTADIGWFVVEFKARRAVVISEAGKGRHNVCWRRSRFARRDEVRR